MTLRKQKSEGNRAIFKYHIDKDSLAEGHVVIILFRGSRTLRISKGESLNCGLKLPQIASHVRSQSLAMPSFDMRATYQAWRGGEISII